MVTISPVSITYHCTIDESGWVCHPESIEDSHNVSRAHMDVGLSHRVVTSNICRILREPGSVSDGVHGRVSNGVRSGLQWGAASDLGDGVRDRRIDLPDEGLMRL